MAEEIIHKAPSVRDDTFPCCGAPLDLKARVSYRDSEVTCTGGKQRPQVDPADMLRARLAEVLGGGVSLVEIPTSPRGGTGNPMHGEPGHECLPDSVMLDLSATLEKVAILAETQRKRLIEKGFDEATAQGLAAHLHAHLVKEII